MKQVSILVLTEENLEAIAERLFNKVSTLLQNLPKEDTALLTTDQICDQYHISRVTINKYQNSGKLIPFSKAGKQHTFRKCDVDKAIQYSLKRKHSNKQ